MRTPRWRAQGRAASSVPTSSSTTAATTTTVVSQLTVDRVKQAESDLTKAEEGITDQTPLAKAGAAFNSAAVALEVTWLQLLAEAGCLSDEEQAHAVAKVRDYTVALQTQLQLAGYYTGKIDGVYGPETVDAVKKLQDDSGLPATGFVDRATALALEAKVQAIGSDATDAITHPDCRTAISAEGRRLLDRPDRRQMDPGTHRCPRGIPNRSRRPTQRRGRRRDTERARTSSRESQDPDDDELRVDQFDERRLMSPPQEQRATWVSSKRTADRCRARLAGGETFYESSMSRRASNVRSASRSERNQPLNRSMT